MNKHALYFAGTPLPRRFFARDPVQVARQLLGKRLVRAVGRQVVAGVIVEAEAYLAEGDPASHAYRGRTPRNASMFGPPGHAYVYAIHSRYCVNAVTETEGVGSAVLIRAIEPVEGLPLMRKRRPAARPLDLTRGPARLCEALAVDRSLDGWDLTLGQKLWIADSGGPAPTKIANTTRIGVTKAKDLRLRFVLEGSPYLSRPVRRSP